MWTWIYRLVREVLRRLHPLTVLILLLVALVLLFALRVVAMVLHA